MECKQADNLIMKYMDSTLTESEAHELNAHLSVCPSCKEDFLIYEALTEEFEMDSAVLFDAPADFESRVMSEIAEICPEYAKNRSSDTIFSMVFGAFSLLFGLGIVFYTYKNELMEFGSHNAYIAPIMLGAASFSNMAMTLTNEVTFRILTLINEFNSLIDSVKYVILALVVVLVAVQYFVFTRNKVEV